MSSSSRGRGSDPDIRKSRRHHIDIDTKQPLRRLIHQTRDSVVTINAYFDKNKTQGTGFMIKGHYIICPAVLVVAPPSRPSECHHILVTLHGIRSKPRRSYSYSATFIGADPAGNIAVLEIDMNHPWNRNNPPIHIAPVLRWSKSRPMDPGDGVILVGNIVPGTGNGVLLTHIVDNRYVDPEGQVPGELIVCAADTTPMLLGCPLIKSPSYKSNDVPMEKGNVVGMIIPTFHSHVIAISEIFIRQPIKAILSAYFQRNLDNYGPFIRTVGSSYIYQKSWLGIGGRVVTPDDYITTLCINAGSIEVTYHDKIIEMPKCIEGYRVHTISHPDSDLRHHVLPSHAYSQVHSSPLMHQIHIGDIITHINNNPIGSGVGMKSTGMIMWTIAPHTEITLKYRQQKEYFEHEHSITVTTLPYHPSDDYPILDPTYLGVMI